MRFNVFMKANFKSTFLITSAYLVLVFLLSFSASASVNEDYEKGIAAFSLKQYKDAYIHVKNVLQASPDYLPAQLLLAQIYQVNGMLEEADKAFLIAFESGGDPSLIFELWGEVLLRLNDSERILSLDFSNKLSNEALVNWHVIRARACMQQQRNLCAQYEYEQILLLMPQHPRGINGLALLAIENGQLAEAEEYLRQSFEQDDALAQTWWLEGKLARAKKDFSAAQRFFNKAFLLAPDNPMMARSLIDAYVASSNFDAALLITEDLMLQTEDDLYVLFVNSWLTSQVESLNVIKPQLEQISNRLANVREEVMLAEPSLFYLRGMVALMQRNFETARENFRSFSKLAESDTQTAILLASTNIALGDKKSAMNALQTHESSLIKDNLDQALLLGSLYLENNRNFKAVDLLENLQQAYPSNVSVSLFEVRVALSRDRVEEGNTLLAQLLQQYPNNRQVLLAFSLHHLNGGQPERAAKTISTLLAEYPTDIAIQNMYAAQLIIEKKYAEAKQVLTSVLAESPHLFAAQYNQATLFVHEGQLQQAKEILETLAALRPDHLQVAFQMAKVDLQLGNLQTAISGFRRILISNGAQANITFAAVAAYAQIGDNINAIDLLRKLIAREPGNETALVQLASFYLKTGDSERTLATLHKLEVFPDLSVRTKVAQAELWMALGNKAKALDIMQHVHNAVPDNRNIHLQWVKLMLASGALEEAERELNVLNQQGPNDPFVYFKKGELAQLQGRMSEAYDHFLTVLEIDDSFDLALAKLYSLSVHQGDFRQLVTLLNRLVLAFPQRYFPRNLLAQYHFYYGERELAIVHYLILLETVAPANKYAMLNRLAILNLPIDSQKSEDYAKQAYALAPTDGGVTHTYGWSMALNGKYQQSLPLLRDASVRNSTDLSLQYHLAYTLNKLGNSEEAQRLLTKAISAQEDFPQRQDAIALLQQVTQGAEQ